MSQSSSVLYLPPGVVAPMPVRPGSMPTGIPFDRAFFERVLPGAVASFAGQVSCGTPIVQVTTVDGMTHFVHGISGVADAWVALHTVHQDDQHEAQVFVPYQAVFRVEIIPCSDARPKTLGFALGAPPATVIPAAPVLVPAAKAKKGK